MCLFFFVLHYINAHSFNVITRARLVNGGFSECECVRVWVVSVARRTHTLGANFVVVKHTSDEVGCCAKNVHTVSQLTWWCSAHWRNKASQVGYVGLWTLA